MDSSAPTACASCCVTPRYLGVLRREGLGARAGSSLQGVAAAQPLPGSQELLALGLLGRQRVDLAQLELEQADLALSLGGELLQLLE